MAAPPPPLPPRASGNAPPPGPARPPLLAPDLLGGPPLGWLSADPRTSSTQSLAPSVPDAGRDPGSAPRRRLLLIYIHGFYGNDQSFRSFPAHVHALLHSLLADSHVIHSKIYPRYKTYKAMELARDNFSAWLAPHESPTTDVVLVGHSMGGLLAADVVLMPNHSPHRPQAFKHRILATLSLDSPFLGLHPGIVVAGISSLFQPAPTKPAEGDESRGERSSPPPPLSESPHSHAIDSPRHPAPSSTLSSHPPACRDTDPCFDPPYWNDAPFREQPLMRRIVHFTSKHKPDGMFNAVRNHILSHIEYGGCLADYPGLVSRYKNLRALEDVDEVQAVVDGHPPAAHARVRFVNYYTLASGRPKPPKSPPSGAGEARTAALPGVSHGVLDAGAHPAGRACNDEDPTQMSLLEINDRLQDDSASGISTPRISVEALGGGNDAASARVSVLSMQEIEPVPMEAEPLTHGAEHPVAVSADSLLGLPPIPDEPRKPTPPDLALFADRDARKQAEREGKRDQKAYDRAVKDRARALRERAKLLEKRRRKAQRDADRLARGKDADGPAAVAAERGIRKFCCLPRRVDGARDAAWVGVCMDGVDEVGAHCGLFVPGPHYDALVGDVASRIAGWVRDDLSTRAVLGVFD